MAKLRRIAIWLRVNVITITVQGGSKDQDQITLYLYYELLLNYSDCRWLHQSTNCELSKNISACESQPSWFLYTINRRKEKALRTLCSHQQAFTIFQFEEKRWSIFAIERLSKAGWKWAMNCRAVFWQRWWKLMKHLWWTEGLCKIKKSGGLRKLLWNREIKPIIKNFDFYWCRLKEYYYKEKYLKTYFGQISDWCNIAPRFNIYRYWIIRAGWRNW